MNAGGARGLWRRVRQKATRVFCSANTFVSGLLNDVAHGTAKAVTCALRRLKKWQTVQSSGHSLCPSVLSCEWSSVSWTEFSPSIACVQWGSWSSWKTCRHAECSQSECPRAWIPTTSKPAWPIRDTKQYGIRSKMDVNRIMTKNAVFSFFSNTARESANPSIYYLQFYCK